MKKCLLAFWMMVSIFSIQAQTPVTFTVDIAGAGLTPDVNGVHIAGNFADPNYDGSIVNGDYVNWSPSAMPMIDNGNGTFSLTLILIPEHYEFKFLNGNDWSMVEDVPNICQVEFNGNDNRFIDVGASPLEYAVCFASCALCNTYAVLFRVDMSFVDADGDGISGEVGEDINPNGVHLVGNFGDPNYNGTVLNPQYPNWDPAVIQCSHLGNGIYGVVLSLNAATYEYKFVNGDSWGFDEIINGVCAINGNRSLLVSSPNQFSDVYCFGSCNTCVAPTSVTFRVDMSNEVVSPNGVHVAGSMQGWNPGAADWEMSDVGNNIYELTKAIQPGDYQFKFINGNSWSGAGNNNESVPAECNTGGNRALSVSGASMIVEFCYNTCLTSCIGGSTCNDLITGMSIPAINLFDNPIFPYDNWQNINEDNSYGWQLVSTGMPSQGNAVYIETYSYEAIGQQDHLVTAPFDFTGTTAPSLSFKVANRRYNGTYYDKLIVSVATSCNGPWNQVWMKESTDLATGPDYNMGMWWPSVEEDWRQECIDLVPYAGNDKVYIRFTSENYYGNNVFIDNVMVYDIPCSIINLGCVDPLACNFDPAANVDDGSCILAASEVCDGLDNDCDGVVDNGLEYQNWYADYDGDGIGNYWDYYFYCTGSPGYVNNLGDCDDYNPSIGSGSTEVCDGIDNDCNGINDDGIPYQNWYADYDGDGIGNYWDYYNFCQAYPGYVDNFGDCDDYNASIGTGSPEICDGLDNDCDGLYDEDLYQYWYADNDGDGYGDNYNYYYYCQASIGYIAVNGDCDDNNNTVYAGAAELCDGLDNNCDYNTDEGISMNYFEDQDADGYGSWYGFYTCNPPIGYVTNDSDCNDYDANWHEWIQFFVDIDGDGFGSVEGDYFCENPPTYYVQNNEDCYPSIITYADADGDGYGSMEMVSCGVNNAFDCNDAMAEISPSALEICDAADNDCDGVSDDGLSQNIWYVDADADGYGVFQSVLISCAASVDGYVSNAEDCNDNNSSINGGAVEVCDAVDNDCDGVADDGVEQFTLFGDNDGDGFGGWNDVIISCNSATQGYVLVSGDCNDDEMSINPGMQELPNNTIDENCDGVLEDITAVLETGLNSLTIYPNPCQTYADITLSSEWSNITVMDLSGRVIAKEYATGKIRLQTQSWESGMYMVQIESQSAIHVLKLEVTK